MPFSLIRSPHPHKECRTGCQRSHNDHDLAEVQCPGSVLCFRIRFAMAADSNNASPTVRYLVIGNNFLSSRLAVLVQFFQLGDGDGQKLNDNGRCNVRSNIQRKDGEGGEGSSCEGIQKIERISGLAGKPLLKIISVYPGTVSVCQGAQLPASGIHKRFSVLRLLF